jgi:outer membrane protein OmpA-like peptidoglycan-associated protein
MKPLIIHSKIYYSILFVLSLLFTSYTGYSQIDFKGKLKDAVNNRANQKTDQLIEASLDSIENGVKKSSTTRKKDQSSSNKAKTDDESSSSTVSSSAASASTTLTSYSKYDFVPGDKILYFEDFSQDAIGDFPALWTTNGSGEVKTVNIASGNWLHMNANSALYWYQKDINFPSNFILEFDLIPNENYDYNGLQLTLYGESTRKEMDDNLYPGNKGLHIEFGSENWVTTGYDDNTETPNLICSSSKGTVEKGKVNHGIIWVQGSRVKIYHRGMKVLDAPTNLIEGTKFTRLRFALLAEDVQPYLSNIKITTAAPDVRSKLLTEGKLVSYGIYFDVNKDVLKAESFGTLNDIAKVLKENPAVRIKIVGHTDADGSDVTNLDLSKRRAAAVKTEMVKSFGIDATRIETDGKGESQPIAPNNTPANKALNRRVEFIKL